MAACGRAKTPLALNGTERETLTGWALRVTSSQALATRPKIILVSAEGRTNAEVARRCAVEPRTVARWRNRFLESPPRLPG